MTISQTGSFKPRRLRPLDSKFFSSNTGVVTAAVDDGAATSHHDGWLTFETTTSFDVDEDDGFLAVSAGRGTALNDARREGSPTEEIPWSLAALLLT